MKNLLLLLFLISCKILPVFAQNATFDAANTAEKEIRTLEMRRFEMMVRKDVKNLSEILAEDLTYVHSNGVLETKAQFLETLDKGKTLYQSIQTEDIKVRITDSMSLITGVALIRAWTGGQTLDLRLRFTDAYAKRDGRWQLISWQSTRVTQ